MKKVAFTHSAGELRGLKLRLLAPRWTCTRKRPPFHHLPGKPFPPCIGGKRAAPAWPGIAEYLQRQKGRRDGDAAITFRISPTEELRRTRCQKVTLKSFLYVRTERAPIPPLESRIIRHAQRRQVEHTGRAAARADEPRRIWSRC